MWQKHDHSGKIVYLLHVSTISATVHTYKHNNDIYNNRQKTFHRARLFSMACINVSLLVLSTFKHIVLHNVAKRAGAAGICCYLIIKL